MKVDTNWIVSGGLVTIAVLLGIVVGTSLTVEAAAPKIPDNCTEISVIGDRHTYECYDLENNPFLQNDLGFMIR